MFYLIKKKSEFGNIQIRAKISKVTSNFEFEINFIL